MTITLAEYAKRHNVQIGGFSICVHSAVYGESNLYPAEIIRLVQRPDVYLVVKEDQRYTTYVYGEFSDIGAAVDYAEEIA